MIDHFYLVNIIRFVRNWKLIMDFDGLDEFNFLINWFFENY